MESGPAILAQIRMRTKTVTVKASGVYLCLIPDERLFNQRPIDGTVPRLDDAPVGTYKYEVGQSVHAIATTERLNVTAHDVDGQHVKVVGVSVLDPVHDGNELAADPSSGAGKLDELGATC